MDAGLNQGNGNLCFPSYIPSRVDTRLVKTCVEYDTLLHFFSCFISFPAWIHLAEFCYLLCTLSTSCTLSTCGFWRVWDFFGFVLSQPHHWYGDYDLPKLFIILRKISWLDLICSWTAMLLSFDHWNRDGRPVTLPFLYSHSFQFSAIWVWWPWKSHIEFGGTRKCLFSGIT